MITPTKSLDIVAALQLGEARVVDQQQLVRQRLEAFLQKRPSPEDLLLGRSSLCGVDVLGCSRWIWVVRSIGPVMCMACEGEAWGIYLYFCRGEQVPG